jgi:hypothetical protein
LADGSIADSANFKRNLTYASYIDVSKEDKAPIDRQVQSSARPKQVQKISPEEKPSITRHKQSAVAYTICIMDSNPPENSSTALPSYSAATTDPSLTNTDAGSDYAYADFTIGDIRAQIIANAAVIKPIYTAERARNEYELELVLMRGSTGQHAAMLLRRNVTQSLSYESRHGKIVLRGKAHATPRQAYESLLSKTETILGDMLRSSKIEHSLPREMNGWNPRQYD